MEAVPSDLAWEAMYAPYDQQTYQAVVDHLRPDDIVVDIGAGDLRLARRMARLVRQVHAIEVNPWVLEQAYARREPLPPNVIVTCTDARTLKFPPGITGGVLLMRHCTCFPVYVEKLRSAGATWLLTNARWRMSVERIEIASGARPYAETAMGWYACRCGRTGFKEGPADDWSFETDRMVSEVANCPHCT
jgi:hypothetical protein